MQQWQSTLQTLVAWWETPIGMQLLQLEQLVIQKKIQNLFGSKLVLLAPESFTQLTSASGMSDSIRLDPFSISKQSLPHNIDIFVVPQLLAYCDDAREWLGAFWQSLAANGTLIITGFNFISYFGLRRLLGRDNLCQIPAICNSQYYLQTLLTTTDFIILSKQRFALSDNQQVNKKIRSSYFGMLYCLIASKQLVTVKSFRPDWQSKIKAGQQQLANPYRI